jgi:cell division protein FtsI/penicillin-binding protein 2
MSPRHLTLFFLAAFNVLALAVGYWTLVARDALLARADNPRALIAYNRIQRGPILDRNGAPLAETLGQPGDYRRRYEPAAAPVVGYASFIYGLSGVEAAADPTLTGIENADPTELWWRSDILAEPQIGATVQLTLDLDLQRAAFTALKRRSGAAVIIDPATGEVLAMASAPTFDPAQLDQNFESLIDDPNAPLVNRATLGLYPIAPILSLFPPSLDLALTPALPIPTYAAEGARASLYQLVMLLAALPNQGVMPAPRLILDLPSNAHPLAILPPDAAARLRPTFESGYSLTVPSGFGNEAIGWYLILTPTRAIGVALENETGEAAKAVARSLLESR